MHIIMTITAKYIDIMYDFQMYLKTMTENFRNRPATNILRKYS